MIDMTVSIVYWQYIANKKIDQVTSSMKVHKLLKL